MATTGNEFGQGMSNDVTSRGPGTMNDESGAYGRAGQRAGETVGRAGEAAREGMQRVGNAAASTVERAAGQAQDAVQRVTDTASDYAERLSTTGEQLMEDARDYIAANPLRTIGIAAAAGFLIARMMR